MQSMYQVNPANVVHDIFDDGEAAIIDLRTGTYFSLNTSAALLWPALVNGTTVSNLVAFAVAAAGESHRAVIDVAVPAFVQALQAEGLVESVDATNPTAADLPADVPAPGEVTWFEAPTFERFDDLQDLLLLDPIHDVSDAGWPNAAAT